MGSRGLHKRRSSQFSSGKESIQNFIQKAQIAPQTPCLENEALASALMKQNQQDRNNNLKYRNSRNQSQLGVFTQGSKLSPQSSIHSNHFLAFSSKLSPGLPKSSPLKLYHQHSDHPPQPSSKKFMNHSQDQSAYSNTQSNNQRQRINMQNQGLSGTGQTRVVSNMNQHSKLQDTDESIFLKESSRFNLGKQISVKCNMVNDFKVFQLDTTSDYSSRKQRHQLQHIKPQNTGISSQQMQEINQTKISQFMKRIQQSNLMNIQKSVLPDESKVKYSKNHGNLVNIITASQFGQLFASFNSPDKIMVNDQLIGKNPFKQNPNDPHSNINIIKLSTFKRQKFAKNEIMSAQIESNSPDLLQVDKRDGSPAESYSKTLLNRIVENQSDNDKNMEQDEDEYPEETLEMNPNIRRSRYF
ncbi:UNKNOWN [Stylonychia lemnae]|uniref:Uncharacterized protein n=1 Tax=Stylonychia lemnae TaxID=5949 RepID=A0A078A827_STYLE|nr:UNKNOWN [Stylonychia lemnae]|eukprot:CDW77737.1 UNKNOWN [Stylonychia lemnae]